MEQEEGQLGYVKYSGELVRDHISMRASLP